jgi:hypothetical protein
LILELFLSTTSYERALLYRFAAYTRLRANEIRNLPLSSFDFDSCIVKVKAACGKRRREDILPQREDIAAELQSFVTGKLPNVRVFKVPEKRVDMLKEDLAVVKIPYVDNTVHADFHALRYSIGSLLTASGTHQKNVQSTMRHSDINLTMSGYTHVFIGQESKAVAGLPDLSFSSKEGQKGKSTGTDNNRVDDIHNGPEKLALKLTSKSTSTALSGCNRLAKVVNEQKSFQENNENDNCLNTEQLGKKRQLGISCLWEKSKANGRIRTDNHWFTKPELYR